MTQGNRYRGVAVREKLGIRQRTFENCIELFTALTPARHYLNNIIDNNSVTNISEISGGQPEIFAKRFFFKNLAKCSLAAAIYRRQIRNIRRAIDLGVGPGTFLFGLQQLSPYNEFIGIDQSPKALLLASQLFKLCNMPSPLLIEATLPAGLIDGGNFFTASYLLTELPDREFFEFCRFARQRPDAQFLVVDYPEVVVRFIDTLGGFRECDSIIVRVNLPPQLADWVGDDQITLASAFAPIFKPTSRAIQTKLGKSQYIGTNKFI